MALKVLNIQDEVSCPICLELLTESLTLDCGHSFCQACITMNTKEVEISPGEESSCPVCGVRFSLGNLWPNQHLVNIMERIREFRLNAEEELKRDLCVRHEEKLRLFCKEDRKVICWLCERSPEHRGHHTFLVEEVVKECQVGTRMEGEREEDGTWREISSFCTHLDTMVLSPVITLLPCMSLKLCSASNA